MPTLKERIEFEGKLDSCNIDEDTARYIRGANFALKEVIEMLEGRRDSKNISWSPIAELNEIINLLKSEV